MATRASTSSSLDESLTMLGRSESSEQIREAFGLVDAALQAMPPEDRETHMTAAEESLARSGFTRMSGGSRPAVVLALTLGEVWIDGKVGISVGRSQLLKRLLEFIATEGPHSSRETMYTTVWEQLYLGNSSDNSLHVALNRLRKKIVIDSLKIDPAPNGGFCFAGMPAIYQWGTKPNQPNQPNQQEPPQTPKCPTNLVPLWDRAYGRENTVTKLLSTMSDASRLVTIIGPGGSGKTRIARMVGLRAAHSNDAPKGGVWFVDLSETTTTDGLHVLLGQTLDINLRDCKTSREMEKRIGSALRGRHECWIILDNFEQLIASSPAAIQRLREQATETRVLVTSREALDIPNEQVIFVGALPTESGVELFVNRAHAVRPDLTIDEASRKTIARIVDAIDGLPLAIELAAARVRMLGVDQIADRLRDTLRLLAGRNATLPNRQQTLRATVEWSWNLLQPWEQSALLQCAVFRSGFSVDAAEVVVDLSEHPDAPWTLDVLQELIDQNLLQVVSHPDLPDETRVRMYQTVHAYAKERLQQSEAIDTVTQRHASWAVHRGEALLADCETASDARPMLRLDLERDNLYGAFENTQESDPDTAADAMLVISAVLRRNGPISNVINSLQTVLENTSGARRLRLLVQLAKAQGIAGANEDARNSTAEALALCEASDTDDYLGEIQVRRGRVAYITGKLDTAALYIDQAMATFQAQDNAVGQSDAHALLAQVKRLQGQLEGARNEIAKALAIQRAHHLRAKQAVSLTGIGNIERMTRRFDEANSAYTEALNIYKTLQAKEGQCHALQSMANVHAECGRSEQAIELFEEALEIARTRGNEVVTASILMNLGGTLLDAGCMERAEQVLRAAKLTHEDHGRKVFQALSTYNLAWLFWLRGDLLVTREYLEEAHALCVTTGAKRFGAMFLLSLSACDADQNNLEAARTKFGTAKQMLMPTDDQVIHSLCDLAEAHQDLADFRASADPTQRKALIKAVRERMEKAHVRSPRTKEYPDGQPSPADSSVSIRAALRLLDINLTALAC